MSPEVAARSNLAPGPAEGGADDRAGGHRHTAGERTNVGGQQEQAAADPEQPTRTARLFGVDARPVEEGAVAAAEVAHAPAVTVERDLGVTAGGALVVDSGGPATQLDGAAIQVDDSRARRTGAEEGDQTWDGPRGRAGGEVLVVHRAVAARDHDGEYRTKGSTEGPTKGATAG